MITYKMADVVKEISVRENNPATSKYDKFVGLEHYITGEVVIRQYGGTGMLNSAMKVFQAGDILVARRNVYLRRASTVDFDGLTSGDSIVLRAENPRIAKLLPFILNSDRFWDYADQHADGTMSKRLSPKILMQYEFTLPSEEEQDRLIELLWSMDRTKQAYKQLISATDELVKSQFIDCFGIPGSDVFGWGLTTLGECCELNPRRPKNMNSDIEYSFVAMPSVGNDGIVDSSITRPYSEVCKGFTYFAENDVLFAKITPCMENGKGGIAVDLVNGAGFGSTEFHVLRPIEGVSDPYWLYIITMFPKFRIDAEKVMTGSGGQRRVPISYLNEYVISLPPIDLQKQFAAFVHQTDKSKFELNQALEALNATYKKLISENLG